MNSALYSNDRKLFLFSLIIVLILPFNVFSKTNPSIPWKEFLQKQDLVWTNNLPTDWTNGPFMGNGLLGTVIYTVPDSNAIRFDIGRTDYEDHRDSTQLGFAMRTPRLPIGYFLLKPVGQIQANSAMRLDLYNAETVADIFTNKGSIHFKAYIHTEKMLLVVETTTTGDESEFSFEFIPAQAISPRQQFGIEKKQASKLAPSYKNNPSPTVGNANNIHYCEQKLLFGGVLTTVWKEVKRNSTRTLLVNSTPSFPQSNATELAIECVKRIDFSDLKKLKLSHRKYWNNYYPISFVSIPDARLESFYWIQMYKLASATRADRPYIDNQGPWLEPTPWPYSTWNLNVQLSYWPLYTSNRLDISRSLTNTLWKYRDNLRKNLPLEYQHDSYAIGRASSSQLEAPVNEPKEKAPEMGCLTWACHNLYLYYRHSMDRQMLRDTLFPLLKGSINYYMHVVKQDANGRWHLPATYSPEYPFTAEDMNFDLSLLKWGCKTLMEIDNSFKIKDPLYKKWEQIAQNLTDYPTDSTGFMVGKDLPLNLSHRHYSHLLMIYPLYDINIEQVGGREIIERSLKHWQSMKSALAGYSYTGAASIAASLGDGDAALMYLNGLWEKGFVQPNTFYKEAGPVIETPLSAAQSIHDMLLQSWGNKIRVFPAIPIDWQNVSFQNLSAEGGFLVSAVRENGTTKWVSIESKIDNQCVINPFINEDVQIINPYKRKITTLENGFYAMELKSGDKIIFNQKKNTNFDIIPIVHSYGMDNFFGSNAMKVTK